MSREVKTGHLKKGQRYIVETATNKAIKLETMQGTEEGPFFYPRKNWHKPGEKGTGYKIYTKE